MYLIELIEHLKTIPKAEALIREKIPGVDFDMVELYMKGSIGPAAEIAFFDADNIPLELIIEIEGVKYENLFPLYLIQEMVAEFVESYDNRLSNQEIAQRILDYRENDA